MFSSRHSQDVLLFIMYPFRPSTRPRNLLWYVCSRGPLRPIFLAAHTLPFPFCAPRPRTERCITYLPAFPPRCLCRCILAVACPPEPNTHTGRCCVTASRQVTLTAVLDPRSSRMQSRGSLVAAIEPAICWTCFSLIRHFPSFQLRSINSPALVRHVSQDP